MKCKLVKSFTHTSTELHFQYSKRAYLSGMLSMTHIELGFYFRSTRPRKPMQCDQQDFQRPLRCLQGWIRRGAQTNVYHWSLPGRRNLYNIVLFDPNDRGWNNFLGKVLRRFLEAGKRRRCGYWLPGHDQLPRLGVTPHQEDRGHRAASIRGQRLADWNWLCCGGLRSQWESKFSLEKKPT